MIHRAPPRPKGLSGEEAREDGKGGGGGGQECRRGEARLCGAAPSGSAEPAPAPAAQARAKKQGAPPGRVRPRASVARQDGQLVLPRSGAAPAGRPGSRRPPPARAGRRRRGAAAVLEGERLGRPLERSGRFLPQQSGGRGRGTLAKAGGRQAGRLGGALLPPGGRTRQAVSRWPGWPGFWRVWKPSFWSGARVAWTTGRASAARRRRGIGGIAFGAWLGARLRQRQGGPERRAGPKAPPRGREGGRHGRLGRAREPPGQPASVRSNQIKPGLRAERTDDSPAPRSRPTDWSRGGGRLLLGDASVGLARGWPPAP